MITLLLYLVHMTIIIIARPTVLFQKIGIGYYLEVEATGYDKILSAPLSVMTGSGIDSVKIEMREANRAGLDSVYYLLFGHPRLFKLTYFVNNIDKQINNLEDRQLFRYNNRLYEHIDGQFASFGYPSFFAYLGTGTTYFIETPYLISSSCRFYDHISTGENINYGGEIFEVYDRLDSIIIQTIQYSDEFVTFFEKVNNYLEERRNPFSSAANNIPSNLSSKIGYFRNVYISDQEVALPTAQCDTIVYVF